MDRPAPFNGMRHIALVVQKFEECEAFYTDIMGMTVLRRASDNLVYLTNGCDNLSLGRAHSQRVCSPISVDHFGFIVRSKDELNHWYEFMQDKGVTLLDAPHDHSDGARSFHCRDPEGHVIQPLYHPEISHQTII
ncbi:VOC family protein [Vibrio coralliilyticus OCN008]|uniref:VOC family protein n=1 Tax=Vibrio coralliilyticus TaxID=190893 RepID=UPI000390E795|nr:VOC family protein [Vibrio coralliilyticus]ERB64916.1 glyoxalase [Vibrio coralliilyticus OCN008]QIJ87094.1 VOC family protein [Vibrio coralliilyticus OCN008]